MDPIPLWAISTLTIVTILGSIHLGYVSGRRRRASSPDEPEGPIGAVTGATLGLLAFLLAFTFGIAADRFQARKDLLLDEVNAIRTVFLRASLVGEPARSEIRRLLDRYVDDRLAFVREPQRLAELMASTHRTQDELWARASALGRAELDSDVGSLLIESINHVLDLHERRATVALQYRVPAALWMALAAVAVVAMGMVGYYFGLSGSGNWQINVALAFAFAAVLWLNVDLDRPGDGLLEVSQAPMEDLRRRMETDLR